MKFHVVPILLSSFAMATSQTIQNGSFEFDNNSSNGNNNFFDGDGGRQIISETDNSGSYLPGWRIERNTIWSSGGQQKGVDIYNGNSNAENPFGIHKNAAVENGPFTGQSPFNAQAGNLALGIYNNEALGTTKTSLDNSITGLTAGQSYRVDYWYSAFGITSSSTTSVYDIDLSVSINGTERAFHHALDYIGSPTQTGGTTGIWRTNYPGPDDTVFAAWKQGSTTFKANSATAALRFIGILHGGPSLLQLDNITITQVPEPSGAIIAVLGAAGFFLRRRR